ncbi:carbohydrate esterase family 4 protein [Cylindrobasidium torrendii FP15055 ss-10]|uniref:chitin deacetylase n=1 Tax=Cylindrobasidium torrendii FP15055 ss-10 TaxID=1314674 RepID=A0A0D7B5C2_9AGAR|nr:carbohydrate esterase family 4 protein [Cylindrobasidium torrendii FP15055 ss-10]
MPSLISLHGFILFSSVFAYVSAHGPIMMRGGKRVWYQPRDHVVERLFKRAPPTDGVDYAEVGSDEWLAGFPEGAPDPANMPQEWKDALKDAQDEGLIPDIPVTTVANDNPVYPAGTDGNSPQVCSSYAKCRNDDYDVWDAPDGVVAIGFDDGPSLGTDKLLGFLDQQNTTATHFLIGQYIRGRPDEFLAIYDQGGHLAVHTYTHPHMTSQTNEQVVAELGYTMEIIHNSTGGRLPKFWRPPYGDADNRVRAIAQEVFGLQTILWNQDTEDWSMSSGVQTMAGIDKNFDDWLGGSKTPGLIMLEHELTEDTVQAFMNNYPKMQQHGWNITSTALLYTDEVYQNSKGSDDDDDVIPADIVGGVSSAASSSAAASASSVSTASGSSTASASAQSSTTTPDAAMSVSATSLFSCVSAFVVVLFTLA